MKKLMNKLFPKKTSDSDLLAECSSAATFYVQERMKGAPIDAQQNAVNYIAHGFFMGYRKKEEQLGAKDETDKK